ncbi:cytochrome b/b6 domain-containing protein [Desulfococcus multivorans]|uniref:Di-heme cytochrome, transmembrane n=1 Tax=Desulfococcus multivorans DSM 2059 TaxID=1121405 RepID=S7TWU6_DESML|nr:cytochrome b/b6 domain-containing protein [Desulfococcus multivorans]AOY58604.1 cytochrome b561 [Desulfococcus multivorans]AQV00905.1 cytochrome B [Desulfococcus multivorans]EPR41546.1 Di-heme cytochrome, transmembrane [Desulfococcus multivorans DSM 2059]SJZ44494.1 Thiosulfate reductase cytochrome b subunit [Desulfococcus multivorans DSM 2059]
MSDTPLKNIYLYTRYERFWHWLQATLILILLVTGFEVNGTISLLGFETAVRIHNVTGITWLIAFAFFAFWVFTTGEWKQYIPTTRKMIAVVRYYGYGIFRGESHPVPKRKEAKHNPLQRLTYLSLAALLLPLQMLTGILYWSYNSWAEYGLGGLSLSSVALVHTALAFAILSFFIVHVYMTTTGHTILAHTKAMITGWETVPEDEHVEEWEKKAV